MKVAILADFPLHTIPEYGERNRPTGHYATWLPQLAGHFEAFKELEVHWIILSNLASVPRVTRWKGQTFHVLPCATRGRATSLFAADRKKIQELLGHLQPDLVHGWGTEDVYALAAVRSGFPNLVSMQGILSHYALKNRMHPREYFQAILELYILWKADRVTTESAWGRDLVRCRAPRVRVTLVEYGVQDHFLEIPWQPDPDKPTAIFIGSLFPRKGIQDAIAAFAHPGLAGAELWVAGSASAEIDEHLKVKAPPNVRWLGRLSAQESASCLSRAWCLVLPTRADTSPNVVKEARVIGMPVISTPCGGQATYIQDNVNGFLVNPGDIADLSRALQAILSDFAKCKALGSRGHQEHRRLLHPQRTAEDFFRLYQEITQKGAERL